LYGKVGRAGLSARIPARTGVSMQIITSMLALNSTRGEAGRVLSIE
jgi:hypothetical protein